MSASRIAPSRIERLENEFGILHLIYHRNHNQHRVAVWWKLLDMLHRNVRKILAKLRSINETKKILRKDRLYQEAVNIARHMVNKGLFKKASYDFNGIIALGQFVPLGLVLVANLSAIYTVVAELADANIGQLLKPAVPQKRNVCDPDDVGEEIHLSVPLSLDSIDDDSGSLVGSKEPKKGDYDFAIEEKKTKRSKSNYEKSVKSETTETTEKHEITGMTRIEKQKKSKKLKDKDSKENKTKKIKKKRSAIDDIFG